MAAGACTFCFEWSHISLELDWHKAVSQFQSILIVPNYSPPPAVGGV